MCTQGLRDYDWFYSLEILAHFRSKVLVDFHHSVVQINCLTGAIISETYIRHITKFIFNDYTILHRSPPQSASSRRCRLDWRSGRHLGRTAARKGPCRTTGPRPVCGGEEGGPHEGGEGRMKAARAAWRRRWPHEGGEGRMEAARAAWRRRGPHEGGEGRMKAARAAWRRRGRMKAARAAWRQEGLHKGGEDRRCGSARPAGFGFAQTGS